MAAGSCRLRYEGVPYPCEAVTANAVDGRRGNLRSRPIVSTPDVGEVGVANRAGKIIRKGTFVSAEKWLPCKLVKHSSLFALCVVYLVKETLDYLR